MDSNPRHPGMCPAGARPPIAQSLRPRAHVPNPLIMHYAAKTPLTHALKVRPPSPGHTGPAPHTLLEPIKQTAEPRLD